MAPRHLPLFLFLLLASASASASATYHRSPEWTTPHQRSATRAAARQHYHQQPVSARESRPRAFAPSTAASSGGEAMSAAAEAAYPTLVSVQESASPTASPIPPAASTISFLRGASRVMEGPPGDEQGFQRLALVLSGLGYSEMASAAALLADSPPVAMWPGGITVFAVPDVFFRAFCPGCSRGDVLQRHIAMGFFPDSKLLAAPTVKVPSASVGICLNVASERGPFAFRMYVDGVEIWQRNLYSDGRYVVHGLSGLIPSLSQSSCIEVSQYHFHHLPTPTAASEVFDVLPRLHSGGYSFMAMAVHLQFATLPKFVNMTVFALDDQAILEGDWGDYISVARFHMVPGHRISLADLRSLQPGTVLPTLSEGGEKIIIDHADSDEIRINSMLTKVHELFLGAHVAIHGVNMPFSRATRYASSVGIANSPQAAADTENNAPASGQAPQFAGSRSTDDGGGWNRNATYVAAAVAPLAVTFAYYLWCSKEKKAIHLCDDCRHRHNPAQWVATCCQLKLCSVCLAEGYLRRHMATAPNPCMKAGSLVLFSQGDNIPGAVYDAADDYYLASEVIMDAQVALTIGFLNNHRIHPRDRVLIRTEKSLKTLRDLRMPPPGRRDFYLLLASDGERKFLCRQHIVPTRRVFSDSPHPDHT